MLLVWVQGAQC